MPEDLDASKLSTVSLLETAARAFLQGHRSMESLVALTIDTPSGGPDDVLIAIIMTNGNTDVSTDEELREALSMHLQ